MKKRGIRLIIFALISALIFSAFSACFELSNSSTIEKEPTNEPSDEPELTTPQAEVTFVLDGGKTDVKVLKEKEGGVIPDEEAIGFSLYENSKELLFASGELISYEDVKEYLDEDNKLTLYGVYTHVKLYDYYKTETLPRIYINTENGIAVDDASLINPNERKGLSGEIPVYNYVKATISVAGSDDYDFEDVTAQVKVRGNYSSTYQKRPLRIKFDKKRSMLGLSDGNKFKNWVLLNEYKDSSMLRNSVAFYLGNSFLEPLGYFCTDFRYVEVYINGSYNGLYVLTEQQEVKEGRVNLPEALDPDDNPEATEAELKNVKIGYFLEYDGYYFNEAELQRFTLNYDWIARLNSSDWFNAGENNVGTKGFTIKNDVYYTEQRDFVKKCMQTIWNVIYDATYNSHDDLDAQPYHTMDEDGNYVAYYEATSSIEAIAKVVDIDSLINMYILQEVCADMDLAWSSFNFTLDMSEGGNHLLTYNAPWDFDSSLGLAWECYKTDELFAMDRGNPWLSVFVNEGWFWQKVYNRFTEIKNAGVFDGAINMMETYATLYESAFSQNFTRWSGSIGVRLEQQMTSKVEGFKSERDAANYLINWFREKTDRLENLILREAEKYD